jgi:hypothetical protein
MEVRAWLWEHGVRQVDFDSLDLLTRAGYQIDSRWSDMVTYGAAPWRSGIVAKYSIIHIICLLQAWKKSGIIRYNTVL